MAHQHSPRFLQIVDEVRVGLRSGINSWLCNQHPLGADQSFDRARVNLHIAQSVGADINAALQ